MLSMRWAIKEFFFEKNFERTSFEKVAYLAWYGILHFRTLGRGSLSLMTSVMNESMYRRSLMNSEKTWRIEFKKWQAAAGGRRNGLTLMIL